MNRPGRFAFTQFFVMTAAFGSCDWHTADVIHSVGARRTCELRYVDPTQQIPIETGDRSHWLQPWRSSQETWPARRVREALGIVGNRLSDRQNNNLLAVAQETGLARLYTSMDWQGMDFGDPSKLPADQRTRLRDSVMALKTRNLRPHIMMQGHFASPCPNRTFTITIKAAAAAGARQIRIDPSEIGNIKIGRSGISVNGRLAGILFTGVTSDGIVTLSKPLPSALSIGARDAAELRFAPFQRPIKADGMPNPAFEDSVSGWEKFVVAVVGETVSALGHENLDIEIWNELGGGSDFLDANTYYDPPVDDGPGAPYELVSRAMLARSVSALRKKGFNDVRVISGFSNTRWTDTTSSLPAGVYAMSRHLALHGATFPSDAKRATGRALRADGAPNGQADATGLFQEEFTPTYKAFFPEQALTPIINQKTIFPDLSTIASRDADGNTHGRLARSAGEMSPGIFVSSFNLNPAQSLIDYDKGTPSSLSETDLWRMKTKSTLRAASAYVGKGVEELIFFSTSDRFADLVDETDTVTGGPVLRVLKKFLGYFAGPDTIGRPRALSLESVSSCDQKNQFEGNGSAKFPPLADRAVVAFFPFQVDDNRFVVPTYVMTRNLTKLYRTDAPATDAQRFDLPPETFTLVIAGLTALAPVAELYDPLLNETQPVTLIRAANGRWAARVPLTDSARLLVLTDR